MYDISRDNRSSALNIKELIRLGNDLITAFKFPEQKDDWERYESLVPLNSFLRFVPQIVYNIFIIKNNLKMEPDKFILAEQAKEIYDIVLRMSELFAPHSDFFASYSNGLLEHFGCSLLTAEDVFQEITHYEYEIFCNKIWNYLHIVPGNEIAQGGAVTANTQIGQALKKPQLFSDKNQDLILEALALYDAERYEQAARLLEKAYKNEPDNPDVLYYYARTLYRFNGKKSFAVYLQLIKILDAQPGEKNCVKITTDASTFEQIADPELKRDIIAVQQEMGKFNNANIFIDLWYVEAYWKMGTLYLDRQDYLHGAYEITRALIGGIGDFKPIREQAYQYLTEAYFFLKKYALARYCA
jgi:tetratricopeptide (TPR) repeat protein